MNQIFFLKKLSKWNQFNGKNESNFASSTSAAQSSIHFSVSTVIIYFF